MWIKFFVFIYMKDKLPEGVFTKCILEQDESVGQRVGVT